MGEDSAQAVVLGAFKARVSENSRARRGKRENRSEAVRRRKVVQVVALREGWDHVACDVKNKTKKIRRRVKTLLEEGADYRLQNGDKNLRAKTAITCRDLLKLEKAMWLFVKEEGLEPAKNKAEKAIRPAVLWRNVSFGTQSEEGSKFVARMLTVLLR